MMTMITVSGVWYARMCLFIIWSDVPITICLQLIVLTELALVSDAICMKGNQLLCNIILRLQAKSDI